MNIYIYGNSSFKKEIHETLEHSNIKFKLDDNTIIKEIDKLSELKQIIKNNPKDIYLIDDEKIIKKNSINKKIKFLSPKDGIEEEFLLDSGIADLSINSLSEIPTYILQKFDEEKNTIQKNEDQIVNEENHVEEEKETVELDNELSQLLAKEEPTTDNMQDNLEDIFNINIGNTEDEEDLPINNNLKEDSKNEFSDMLDFNDNFGLNNISFDYDDENIGNPVNDNEFDMDFEDENESEDEVLEELNFLNDIFDNEKKDELKNEDNQKIESNDTNILNESLQGEESMNDDEFFELDSLNEKDLLEALNCSDDISEKKETNEKSVLSEKNNTISVSSSSNTDELAQLISKLLTNKTLEITIKIKD